MIRKCDFADVAHLAEPAGDDGVTVKSRPGETWYRCGDVACACLWRPQNRKSTGRLSSCWVHPNHRGRGIGKALVLRRVSDGLASDVERLDTYAYRERLFKQLDFDVRSRNSTSTYLVYEI